MRENIPKFNPAVLPSEFMKSFERTDSKEPRHFLYPGQVFATRDPITISTILGSCAAVCLWDHHKKAGGMNHYLLPEGLSDGPNRLRYGNVANPELLSQVLRRGPIAVSGITECGARGKLSSLRRYSGSGERSFRQAWPQAGLSDR
jgi:hypothetical protein